MVTPLTTSGSTVLSPLTTTGLSDSGSMNNLIVSKIKEQASDQYTEKYENINNKYQVTYDRIDKESDRYINVLASINNAKMAMENGEEAITEIDSKMLEMRSTLYDIKNSSGNSAFIEQYNEHIREINTTADMYAPQFNPIGRVDEFTWEPNTIEYKEDLSGRMIEKEGVNITANFRINSDDGTTWVMDFTSNSLVQREGFDAELGIKGNLTEKETSVNTGLELISYDEATGAVEVKAMVEGVQETITGTLEKSGLELMGAWFYNDFENDEDFERAYSDLNKASSTLITAKATVQMHNTSIASSENRVGEVVDNYKNERKEEMTKQMEEQMDLQYEVEKQYQAMIINLDAMQRQQANYVSVFASSIASNPMLDFLV